MPPPAPISHSPTLPRLSPADHALFNLFASSHLDLHTLAEKSGRDLTELTAWAAAPEIRLYTEAYRELAGRGVINTAIAALIETMKATENLVEKRRAAQAVIRAHQTPRRQPAFTTAAASPSGGGAADRGVRGGGGSASTPRTQPPRANTSPSPTQPPPTPRLSPPSPAASGRGARAAGGEGSVSTPSKNAPSTNIPPTARITPGQTSSASRAPTPRVITHAATSPIHPSTPSPIHTPVHPLTSSPVLLPSSLSPFASRPSPLTRLTAAAGAAGPAP